MLPILTLPESPTPRLAAVQVPFAQLSFAQLSFARSSRRPRRPLARGRVTAGPGNHP